jgi:DNA-binding MarR family transcriptional regulator
MSAVRRRARRGELYRAIDALLKLTELVERRRGQLAREAGLSDLQARVLEEVGSETFMPSLFARSRERSPAAVSRTLRQLLDQGLVRSEIAEGDGRRRSYALTPRGKRSLDGLRSRREHAIDVVWEELTPSEVERFARFAERLAARLADYAEGEVD